MSQPAPVSVYTSLEAVRLHCSWLVPWDHAGTTGDSVDISSFSGINYNHPDNRHLLEDIHILSVQSPVSSSTFLQIRKTSEDPFLLSTGIHSWNGLFPVLVTAFLYSTCGLAHSLYCLLSTAVHGQDIPDDQFHNDRRSYHDHARRFPDNLL